MAPEQVKQLVKMANQIALNLAAWGDDAAVARKTCEHMEKFWTPAMCDQILEYWRAGGDGLSALACSALVFMHKAQPTETQV